MDIRRTAYFYQLDGLRGLAILAVLLHHFWPTDGPLVFFEQIAHAGWIGVDLFFVISGFLICGILLDAQGSPRWLKTFYVRRALRIFPLYYLFVFSMAIVIPALQHSSELFDASGSLWWYILYAGNIREALTGHEPAYVMAPLWSLAIEEQFYLVFPVVVLALRPATLQKALWAVILVAPVFRLVTFLMWPENERMQYLATASRMDNIAIGCLLALAFRLGKVHFSTRMATRIAFAAIVLIGGALASGGLNRMLPFCRILGYSITGIACGALVLWALVVNPGWLRTPALTALGRLCYGVYLLQRPTQVLLGKLLLKADITLNPTVRLAAEMIATIMVATLSWHIFEKHILKLKERIVPRQPIPSQAPQLVPAARSVEPIEQQSAATAA